MFNDVLGALTPRKGVSTSTTYVRHIVLVTLIVVNYREGSNYGARKSVGLWYAPPAPVSTPKCPSMPVSAWLTRFWPCCTVMKLFNTGLTISVETRSKCNQYNEQLNYNRLPWASLGYSVNNILTFLPCFGWWIVTTMFQVCNAKKSVSRDNTPEICGEIMSPLTS